MVIGRNLHGPKRAAPRPLKRPPVPVDEPQVAHPVEQGQRVARVYPRLDFGGAENGIIQLLATIPSTHLIITHWAGRRADEAAALAERTTVLEAPRFPQLVEHLREVDLVHLHTVNDYVLLPLAALLAGPPVIVQTLHNGLEAEASAWADHSIVLGEASLAFLPRPAAATVLGNGVAAPRELPAFRPWFEEQRPLRLVEVRRPDKQVHFTLEDLVATGALDHLDWTATVVGPEGEATHPRVTRVGLQLDPSPWVRDADLFVCGSLADTFGRTTYEAMAAGTVPVITPLEVHQQNLAGTGTAVLFESTDRAVACRELALLVEQFAAAPDTYRARRKAGYALVQSRHGVEAMGAQHAALYERLLAAPRPQRDFGPEDLGDTQQAACALKLLDALFERRDLSVLSDLSALHPRAQGLLAYLLATRDLIADDKRADLLTKADVALGPRCCVRTALGNELRIHDEHARAAEMYTSAIELDPARTSAYFGLAECQLLTGDLDQADQTLARLQRTVPATHGVDRLRDDLARALG